MRRRLIPLVLFACLAAAPAMSASAPDNWDGLVRVEAKKMALVYLRPQADFRGYTKVIVDRPEVAFHKDWQRDYNRSQRSVGARVSDRDVREAIDEASESFMTILANAYTKAGYQVVTEPGPDVLRLATAIINLEVDAPDTFTAGRSRTFSSEGGEATLVLEARDSVSGSVMGRAVDRRAIGDHSGSGPYLRNSVTNRADFEEMFRRWAKLSAEGIDKLKSMSPVGTDGARQP
jgi:hypothetical protein